MHCLEKKSPIINGIITVTLPLDNNLSHWACPNLPVSEGCIKSFHLFSNFLALKQKLSPSPLNILKSILEFPLRGIEIIKKGVQEFSFNH